MLEISSLVIIAFAFFAGGFVKGVAGMGLPAITVAILVFGFGLPTAMALMILPGLVSNLYQAFAGPQWRVALLRIAHRINRIFCCTFLIEVVENGIFF